MKHWILPIIALAIISNTALADETNLKNMAVGAKVSTLGLGVEIIKPVKNVDLRFGINHAGYDHTGDVDGTEYNLDLSAQTITALADWHPSKKSGFFVSGGAMINDNQIDGTATAGNNSNETIKIGGTEITEGKVNTSIGFDDVNPYVGIGYRKPIAGKKGWGFTSELGMLYQGSPNVDLSVTGADVAITDADIAAEEAKMEDDIKDFKYYPVASVGLVYNF